MNYHSQKLLNKHTFTQRPLIMIADDDEDNLLFMGYLLEFLQFSYLTTSNSQSLLTLAKEYLPDLILLDIVMPKINGIEVAYQLKQNKTTCKIPLIAITGLVEPEHQAKIKEAGFSNYLSKPFLITDLEIMINRYLS